RTWVQDHVARSIREDGSQGRMLLLESMVRDLVREIRYVGLEFGVHGVVPYRTDQVWSRRFGDCKDQALLMAVLLEEAGFDAEVTLVRTASQGRLTDPLPSLTFFDHAVVYLSDLGLYVDPTARYFGLGTLPPADQGAQVLRVGGDSTSSLTLIPMDTSSKNRVAGDYTIVVDGAGQSEVSGSVVFHGTLAANRRALLQDQGAREHRVELMLNQRYTGLTMTSYELEHLEDRDRPLSLSFSGKSPWIAKRDGGLLQVVSPVGLSESAPHLASLRGRRTDLVLGVPAAVRSRTRYLVPSDWRPSQIPAGGEEESAFGSWSVHWWEEPGAVVVDARLVYEAARISPEHYPQFRAFLRRLDEHLREPLIWEPTQGEVQP
ncbi:MAG: hypothetical protein VX938_08400, partial [Myxococcota bacterium]|nr:hypothetical protein [Myxococcota bacterium]